MALRAINSEFAGANRAVASRLGLNDSNLAVLDILHRDGPQTPTALARRTRIGATTMTSVLRRLEDTGWVERRPSDGDMRSFTIHATSIERLTELYRPTNEQFVAALDRWPSEQRDQLVIFLEDVAKIVRDSTDDLVASR